ncbi:MAG: ADP-glyceromanno-heptose 6-epimerase [Elusimicrobia bacterium]|nr:ADP-glyceromanno-heptose 6-epimerase [Candidatus Obscuribacterium magneticum]
MRIILTGGAGFIGSCFLWRLNAMGIDDVLVVDTARDPSKDPNLKNKKFKEYLSREELLDRIERGQFKEVDVVVHLGACADTTEMDKNYLAQNNVAYSQRLALWALSHKKRFHYASSAAVYGNGNFGYSDDDAEVDRFFPLNPYGQSKLEFDRWLIQKKLSQQVVGYRYFNVFGPNEYHKGEMRSMVCKAFQQMAATGRVKLFATTRPGHDDGSEERDFVYVKDVLDVMAYFLEQPDRHGIFNVGPGRARSFKDLALAVYKALGKPPQIDWILMPPKLRGQYQYFTQAKIEKLRSAGYSRPFQSLESSVADYVQNHLAKIKPYL